MGKRPLLLKTEAGDVECISIEVEEEALTISAAAFAFRRLAEEFLQDKSVDWAFLPLGDWIVEPEPVDIKAKIKN